jgi:hypothetical protein
LNLCVSESIKQELEQLESVGRVSAHGQRPVHAEFGFSQMKRKKQQVAAPASSTPIEDQFDDAFARLKARTPSD